MAIAFIFRGAGTYVIDDIDNSGVERGQESCDKFRVVRKVVFSKSGWTNCRPLSAFCPDGLLFANLGRANYKALERVQPLSAFAADRSTTVAELIRSSSRQHGMWSLAGPDRAITAVSMESVGSGIRDVIAKHEDAVRRTLPRPQDQDRALKRLRQLMPEPRPSQSLLGYFQACLSRGLALVGRDVSVLSAARDFIDPHGGRLFPRFLVHDPDVVAVYNFAAGLQGSRVIDEDHPLPYYSVGLAQGERRDLVCRVSSLKNEVIAPKILVIENAANMALPATAASLKSILAREHAYRGLNTGSSQVFFESTWLESLERCRVEANVDEIFQRYVDHRKSMPLGELVTRLTAAAEESDTFDAKYCEEKVPPDLDGLWAGWVLRETLHDIRTWHYPVLMYAVAGDAWLEDLKLRSYTTRTGGLRQGNDQQSSLSRLT